MNATRTSIILAISIALAFVLFWWVGNYAESYFAGAQFPSRFPEKTLCYSADEFKALVRSDIRSSYVYPVLFPLDLFVMLALSLSMGAASWYWIRQVRPRAARWVLVSPAIYLLSDLIEDSLLAWLLWQGDAESAAAAIPLLKTITAIKFASIAATMIQTVLAAWLFLRAR